MAGKLKYYVILHTIVLVWGFTGILGDQITISADYITFFRMGISFLSLLLLGFFIKDSRAISSKQIASLILVGGIVGLHWFTFFYAIKASTVSLGVVCMSSATLFTSIIEPIVYKRKFLLSELILSFAIIGGIVIIFGFESQYYVGILSGLTSAFLAATFTVFNGKFVNSISSFRITKYEMLGGTIVLFSILAFSGKVDDQMFRVSSLDWVYLSILGIICTTVAFMVSVWVMKYLTPFTVSMSLNMEPIYTLLLVLLIGFIQGSDKEHMSRGFYIGALIIISAIFANALLKKRASKKKSQVDNLESAQ